MITWVGESNLHSFLSGNGRGVSRKLSGNQEGGKNYITVDGERKKIDVPAQLINGRTMIPVRAVAEAFNCKVEWDGSIDTATINSI